MWQARVDAAEVRLESIREKYNAAARLVTTAHNIAPTDRINLETGEISRVPNRVDIRPAEPELATEPPPA
jgi:hypothetical protein